MGVRSLLSYDSVVVTYSLKSASKHVAFVSQKID